MDEQMGGSVSIAVDSKHYLIRIHRATLRQLGNPRYIQFLVNPETMVMAIRAVDRVYSGDQSHKIKQMRIDNGHSCEIYSQMFVKKLCRIAAPWSDGITYHLNGEIMSEQRTAVFSLKSLTQSKG